MTDAPERIWAGNWLADVGETSVWDIGEWRDEPWQTVNTVEYIRADLATPLDDPRVKALQDKAQAVVDRWDSPLWKDLRHTGTHINELRDAISALEENK